MAVGPGAVEHPAPSGGRTWRVLFICTGNFYRSRFCEGLFNHVATGEGMPWRAFSRGLSLYPPQGLISPATLEAFAVRGIDPSRTAPRPLPLSEADLEAARVRVALNEPEHEPLMRAMFPRWVRCCRFWRVPDLGEMDWRSGTQLMEELVHALVEELRGWVCVREGLCGAGRQGGLERC